MDSEEKIDNKLENTTSQENFNHHRHTTRSTELLKRLAEFTSKKEEILNKLSVISDRMEKRIAESNKESLDKDDGSDIPDFKVNAPDIVESVKFCRVRETNEPLVSGGTIVLFMPKSAAIDDNWKMRSTMDGQLSHAYIDDNVKEDGIILPNNGHCLKISTGIRLSLPKGYIGYFESVIGGTTVIGPSILLDSDNQEVSLILKNITDKAIKIEFDKAIILVTLIKTTNVRIEEMLNSTFDSWIQGKVR